MRAPAAVALLAYSVLLLGVAAVGVGVDGCAAGTQNDYDSGYTPPTGTGTPTSTPDATSPGDDSSSPPPSSGDEPSPPSEPEAGEEAGDDASDEAAAPPCASGQTCVDQAPSGWTGYVQLRIAMADAGAGSCAAPYAAAQLSGVADPTGAPAQCATCSCGAPTPSIACNSGMATGNYLCGTGPEMYTTLTSGSCVSITGANGATEAPPAPSTGSCAAVGGQMIGTLDAGASSAAVVCSVGDAGAADAGPGPTCMSSQGCAAPTSTGSTSGVCIYQSGIQTCPSGTEFTDQHIVGTSTVDTRGCACTCGTPQCPTDGVVEVFTSATCTGTASKTLNTGAACTVGFSSAFSAQGYKYIQSRSDAGGGCEVDDAGPSGGVSVDTATGMTLCCIP